jgi:KDO2-lipid IV(A) lauroyltransferase
VQGEPFAPDWSETAEPVRDTKVRRRRLPTPGTWRWRRRRAFRQARDRLSVAGIHLLRRVLEHLGLRIALQVADVVGTLAWLVAYAPRRVASRQLADVMPELSPRARRSALHRMFRGIARSVVEVLLLDRIQPQIKSYIDVEGVELIDDALAAGRGLVVITGHIGNWELLAGYFGVLGYPVTVLATRVKGERLNAEMLSIRRRLSVTTIVRDRPGALRDVLRCIRQRSAIAMVMDQDTRGHAIFAPFLGRAARTPTGPAALACCTGCPVLAAFIHRQQDGRHRISVRQPGLAPLASEGGRAARAAWIAAATVEFNRLIEAEVRGRPDEWVWWHRRWRRQPGREVNP